MGLGRFQVTPRAFLFALLSAIALVTAGCNEDSKPASPWKPPVVSQARSDLLYFYYGDTAAIAEAYDHVNAVMVWGWGEKDWLSNVEDRLTEAREHNLKVILGLPQSYGDTAPDALRVVFSYLQSRGLLSNVVALYPADEPDLDKTDEQVRKVNAMIRGVAAEFPELAHVKLAVTYTSRGQWQGLETYDWIGFDDYTKGDAVLWNETWIDLKARLRPEQRIILVPGGACNWKNRPDAFLAVAQTDPQVIAVMPFLWIDTDPPDPTVGIRSCTETRAAYIDAGTRVINRRP